MLSNTQIFVKALFQSVIIYQIQNHLHALRDYYVLPRKDNLYIYTTDVKFYKKHKNNLFVHIDVN